MSLTAKITQLATAMNAFRSAVMTMLAKIPPFVLNADNTRKFGGKTPAQYANDLETLLSTHTSQANPHGTTAEKVNAYTTNEVNTLMLQKIKQGILPISMCEVSAICQIRQIGTNNVEISTTNLKAMLSGRFLHLPGTTWHVLRNKGSTDFQSLDVVGGTYYLYLEMFEGSLYFTADTLPRSESDAVMWLGTFTRPTALNETPVDIPTSFINNPIIRIDTFRVSKTASGQAIPVSSDNVNDPQALIWK